MDEKDVEDLAKIIIEGFMTNPEFGKFGKYSGQALETFKAQIMSNVPAVEKSLRRFHFWMHLHKIGEEDYRAQDNGHSDSKRDEGNR